MVSFLYQER